MSFFSISSTMFLYKSLLVVPLLFAANSLATPILFNNYAADRNYMDFNNDAIQMEQAEINEYRNRDNTFMAQDVDEQVCQADSPFFIPHLETAKQNAAAVCNQYGGDLAPISNANFIDVTSLLFNCRGPMSHAWIKTWDDTDYASNCLTLYTGASIPGGGIDINCVGEDLIVPICIQKRGSSVVNQIKQPPQKSSAAAAVVAVVSGGIQIVPPTPTSSVSISPFNIVEPVVDYTIPFVPSITDSIYFEQFSSVSAPPT